MLLCLSSRDWRSVFEESVEVAGEVALEQAYGVAGGFAFGDAACDVVLGCWVVQPSLEDHGVQCAVQLAVAAAAESMPGCLAA